MGAEAGVRRAGWLPAWRALPRWLLGRRAVEGLAPEILEAVVADASSRLGQRLTVTAKRWSRTGCEILWLEGDAPYVAKVAAREGAAARLRANVQALTALSRVMAREPAVARRLPQVVLAGEAAGRVYSVETRLPGEAGTGWCRRPGGASEVTASATDFLLAMHRASGRDAVMDETRWRASLAPSLDAVGRVAAAHGLRSAYASVVARLRGRLLGRPLRVVFAHGNYWVGNLLWQPGQGLTGVIDWDNADEAGLPAADVLYLLVRGESVAREVSLGAAVAAWVREGCRPALESRDLARYREGIALAEDAVGPLFLASWLQQVYLHARYGSRAFDNPKWVKANVLDVLVAAAGSA